MITATRTRMCSRAISARAQKKTKLVKNDKGEVYKGKVYETDKNGTITITTDGKDYSIKAEEGKAQ